MTNPSTARPSATRYVRPVVGRCDQTQPMTVEWARYTQGLTDRPSNSMLTGPVTMLAWSIVRDDQPLGGTVTQVALALRDEVADLEEAGIAIIQVDEPALRETLPLRERDRAEYRRPTVNARRPRLWPASRRGIQPSRSPAATTPVPGQQHWLPGGNGIQAVKWHPGGEMASNGGRWDSPSRRPPTGLSFTNPFSWVRRGGLGHERGVP